LNNCEENLHNIRIIPDSNDDEPVQRAIGLTDLPASEKQLLISTAVTSTVAIKVLASIFDCDFEVAASHIRAIGQAEFGAMSSEQIETHVAELAKKLCENPAAGVFQIEV